MGFIAKLKKKIEHEHVELMPYLLMIQRGSFIPVYKWSHDKFVKGVMNCYKRHLGYKFDLNNPKTFNEKLQWYKVYYQREDFGHITDKVTFKEYIKNKLGEGYTIPMYGWWDDVDALERDWDSLPEKFVLKSNLASDARGVMIIEKKSEINFSKIKKTLKSWLNEWNTLLNSWDWRFYNSTPKILAEKYMQDESGELRDYKFFCFEGSAPYFRVDYGRKNQHHATFFNSKFEEIDLSVPTFPKDPNVDIKLPETIADMYKMACEISKEFPFIRVDFFSCNGKIYLSELTFAPGGGVSPYPKWFDEELGSMFRLPV